MSVGSARHVNTRRQFLQASASLGALAATPWSTLQALAAASPGVGGAASGYRALVCLFMYGGNDGNNLLVPTDATRYTQYQRARPNLALERSQLHAIPGDYGLHPAMPGLAQLVNSGQAALVANVGPLMVPTTQAQWAARSVPLPANLFSHNDQQGAWQSAMVDAPARSGWGGRLLEQAVPQGSNNRGYSAISVAGANIWQTGDLSLTPYRVSPSGRFGFDFYSPAGSSALDQAITSLLAEARSDPLEQTWLNVMGRSIDNQRILTGALSASALKTSFPDTDFGRQLQMVARLISARGQLGLARQCFFCSIGGFDTHGDDQLQRQAELLGEISAAVSAFSGATQELAVANDVTLFSASDFGRTLASNGKGSDHGWGNHHFVVGGSVNGGRVVGRFPTLAANSPDDVGQGVWIPDVSTDQLYGDLATWFGADAALADALLPRLRYFNRDLALMRQ